MKFVILVFGAYIGYNYFQTKAAQADPTESILNVLMVGSSVITVTAFVNKLGSN